MHPCFEGKDLLHPYVPFTVTSAGLKLRNGHLGTWHIPNVTLKSRELVASRDDDISQGWASLSSKRVSVSIICKSSDAVIGPGVSGELRGKVASVQLVSFEAASRSHGRLACVDGRK